MSDEDPAGAWRPFAWFLLRATGFPLSRLLDLADAPPSDGADWEAHLRQSRARLAAELDRDDVAEALFVSNPELADRIASWQRSLAGERRNASDRARERTLLRYLGRFCAKNETTSFFGASALGRFDRVAGAEPLPIADVRGVFVEQWVAQALLTLAAADLAAAGQWKDRPRRAPLTGIDAAGVCSYVARPGEPWFSEALRVDGAVSRALLAAADGTRTRATLIAACEGLASTPEIEPVLSRLESDGFLRPSSRLPNGTADVLEASSDVLRAQPASPARERWLARFTALAALATGFEAARGPRARETEFQAVEDALTSWLGSSPRRHPGSHYASRTAVHEKADRAGRIVGLPAGWADALHAPLTATLDLALAPLVADRLTFRAWFDAQFGRDRELPWGEVCRALDAAGPRFHLAAPPDARALRQAMRGLQSALRQHIEQHLATHGASRPFALPASLIAAQIAPLRALLDQSGVAFSNPDLMPCAAPDGRHAAVLGEAHDQVLLTPSLYPAAPDRDVVLAATRELLSALAAPDRPALVVRRRAAFMAWSPDLGAVALELDADSGQPPDRRAPLAELAIRLTDGGFRFRVTTHAGQRLDVLPLTHGSRTALASRVFPVLPLDLAGWLGGADPDALPRLSLGPLVLHRRRFRVASDAWAHEPRAAISAELLRRAAPDLPRVVFTRPPGEPKPLVIDLANPCALEMLRHEARRAPSLTLIEMLPDPDGLWLCGPGGRHTAELRTVLVRGGGNLPHLLTPNMRPPETEP
ncbi:MAG: hypothetical protein R3F39_05230 [Myxococcota bacterium]